MDLEEKYKVHEKLEVALRDLEQQVTEQKDKALEVLNDFEEYLITLLEDTVETICSVHHIRNVILGDKSLNESRIDLATKDDSPRITVKIPKEEIVKRLFGEDYLEVVFDMKRDK